MEDAKTISQLSKIESDILDLINEADEMTTSDLQGAVQAQVLNAFRLGKAKW